MAEVNELVKGNSLLYSFTAPENRCSPALVSNGNHHLDTIAQFGVYVRGGHHNNDLLDLTQYLSISNATIRPHRPNACKKGMGPLLAEYKQGRNMIFDISAHPTTL